MTTFEMSLKFNCYTQYLGFDTTFADEPSELDCLELVKEHCSKNNIPLDFVNENGVIVIEPIFNGGELYGDPTILEINLAKLDVLSNAK